jgi:hypothetical protein
MAMRMERSSIDSEFPAETPFIGDPRRPAKKTRVT